MYPSSFSTWAMPVQILLLGMSTSRRPTRLALRIRVSMSAMGSWLFIASFVSERECLFIQHSAFIIQRCLLPARLLHPRNLARQGQLAEHDAGDLELPQHAAGAAGQLAAVS